MLSASSLLDRDLGLGSLERVELLSRLEEEFGVRVPDQVGADANTPDELSNALLQAPGAKGIDDESPSILRASATDARRSPSSTTSRRVARGNLREPDSARCLALSGAARCGASASPHLRRNCKRRRARRHADVRRTLRRGRTLRGRTGAARRARRRTRFVDAADVARIFCFVRGNSSRRRDSCSDLSAVSRGSHRRIRRAPIGDSQQRGSLPVADVSSRRSRCALARAAREIARLASSMRNDCSTPRTKRLHRRPARCLRISPALARAARATSHCCNTLRDRPAIRKASR